MGTRNLNDLSENTKPKADLFFAKMKELGDPMTAHDVLRTKEEQAKLVEQGASKTMNSYHLTGEAFDAHFDTYPNFPPGGHERWLKAIEVAKEVGLENGGDMWGWDWNHFQDNRKPLEEPWYVATLEWATGKVTNGERPFDNITRVEVMEMFRKYEEYKRLH